MASLYERVGGETAVMAAVALFYEKVLADSRVARFFSALNMNEQTAKQTSFLTWALDGPKEYRGKALDVAHARLVAEEGLDDTHFDAVAELLDQTLAELGVGDSDRSEVMERIAGLRDVVLGRQ